MKKKLFIFIGLILLLPSIVQGAELRLKKTAEVINMGDVFDVSLVLNTEDESINAIEAILKYSDNLKIESISDGNSIINLWISKPKLENNRSSIFLSGLVPGGVKTSEGIVLNLTFKSLSGDKGNIWVEDAKVFLNSPDVSETKIKVSDLNFEIQNNSSVASQGQKLVLDFLPPDEFEIYLSKDRSLFSNSWFISFNAQDKGSGMNHYEVRERFLGLFGDWKTGESPYQLSHQGLFGIIEVRAVDNIGRERTTAFIPIRIYLTYGLLTALLMGFLIFKFVGFIKRKKL